MKGKTTILSSWTRSKKEIFFYAKWIFIAVIPVKKKTLLFCFSLKLCVGSNHSTKNVDHATAFSSRMGQVSFPKTNTQEFCLRSLRFHFGGGNLAINSPHSRCGRQGKRMLFDKQSAEIRVAPTINPTVVRSTQASLVGCGIVGINQETMAVWSFKLIMRPLRPWT